MCWSFCVLKVSRCVQLAEKDLGGQIGYLPNHPQGSIFWVRVPLQDRSISDWSFGGERGNAKRCH